MKSKKLVIDTAAFFKNVPLWEYAEEFYTVKEVIDEIRDRETKHHINALPIELKFRSPSADSMKFILEFTKKTGDFASLSLADTKVLALAYEIEVETKKTNEHLRKEPRECRTTVVASKPNTDITSKSILLDGWYMPSNSHPVSECNSLSADIDNESLESDHLEISSVLNSEVLSAAQDLSHKDFEPENYCLNSYHLLAINNYFENSSYVNGFAVSCEDFLLLETWIQQNQEFQIVAKIVPKLIEAGEFYILMDFYRNLINYGDSNIIDGYKNLDSFHSLKKPDECLTYDAMIDIVSKYYTKFPHFLRWFFHILSIGNNIIYLPSAETSLKNIINRISKDNEEKDSSSPSVTEESLQEKLQSLNIEHDDPLNDESGEGDNLSTSESDEGFQKSSEDEVEFIEEEEEDDDDEGWITPASLKMKKDNQSVEDNQHEVVEVACITADYSMQNTLKHIGLHVLGVDGKLITNIRTFILRCYACFKTTDKMDLMFCKKCGHKTLKRVSVTMNPDGTQRIWISTRRPINLRGTKFPLPMPQGGKHAVNPILVADQREAQQRAAKLMRMRNDPLHEDYGSNNPSPFLRRDVYSRAYKLGVSSSKNNHRGIYYWEQKNPNEPVLKKKTNRKKRQ